MKENNMNMQHGSGSGPYGHFTETIWRPLMKSPAKSYGLFTFFFVLVVGALVSTGLLDTTTLAASGFAQKLSSTKIYPYPQKPCVKFKIPLDCTALKKTKTCPRNYPTSFHPSEDLDPSSPPMCPEYFRWIHEDLRHWACTGITLDMVERLRKSAHFRLVIVNGRVYVERYRKAYQTRDVFTIWGILQLLRKYPGKVPDLDMMFNCFDRPIIKSKDYSAPDGPVAPPLFRYCSDDQSLDVVFPDWSFWGWPEINIKPWEPLLENLKKANKRMGWTKREPYAFWKGNPGVAGTRRDLMKCNVSEKQDWNARLYAQDWFRESKEKYKKSDLASQCIHRYKIYIEGEAWSVSEKYILACDSVTLLVKLHYYDFFTRSLIPMHHYWPIKEDNKCRSIKFAVDWGNSHQQKAQAMGKAASGFIQEELKMNYVYDYMYHLLNQYSKLLRYKPTIPEKAVEFCSETMACSAKALPKKSMIESMVTGPSETSPCTLPPPYDPPSLNVILRRYENSISQVELWEKNYWENQTKVS